MFENIVGQDHATQAMIKALNNPVHSYAFYGVRGTFVDEAARIFAARLIDDQGSADSRVVDRVHPDVIEYEPISNTYRVKEDVRDSMLKEINKSPIESKTKVVIVHDAHLLRTDSANTLLKSLEEPPANVHWILIAPSIDSLLATIRSRCFGIHFSRLVPVTIENILIQDGVDSKKAHDISIRCSGRLDRAKKMVDFYLPLYKCANHVVKELKSSSNASTIARSAQEIIDTFDEISITLSTDHKSKMTEIKKEIKNSGYSEKVASTIVSDTKKGQEATEKKLRRELLVEFLDMLTTSLVRYDEQFYDPRYAIHVDSMINQFRKRLVYNPSELLFLESLLSSISVDKAKVNL